MTNTGPNAPEYFTCIFFSTDLRESKHAGLTVQNSFEFLSFVLKLMLNKPELKCEPSGHQVNPEVMKSFLHFLIFTSFTFEK